MCRYLFMLIMIRVRGRMPVDFAIAERVSVMLKYYYLLMDE